MQINRLFEITYILLNKRTVTAKELAERFDVSTRTIYRDIDALSLAGIPVYTEKGKSGGISLLPDFVLNKSILSEKEQNEILSALQSFSVVKAGETDQVLKKLSAIFNKNTVPWLEVDFSGWGFENNFFDDLKIAIAERRITEFDYYNSYGEKTFRHVEPVQLWFKSMSWYLKGFCLTKKEMRLYKLTRIKNLAVTDSRFLKRDLVVVSDEKDNRQEQKNEVMLKLRIKPEMAYRVFDDFYENMVEKQPDGSFIVKVLWPEDNWLYGFILSFGEYIEVLEPEHIRKIIKDKAEKIFKLYQ